MAKNQSGRDKRKVQWAREVKGWALLCTITGEHVLEYVAYSL